MGFWESIMKVSERHVVAFPDDVSGCFKVHGISESIRRFQEVSGCFREFHKGFVELQKLSRREFH